jgi:hypothetical protein
MIARLAAIRILLLLSRDIDRMVIHRGRGISSPAISLSAKKTVAQIRDSEFLYVCASSGDYGRKFFSAAHIPVVYLTLREFYNSGFIKLKGLTTLQLWPILGGFGRFLDTGIDDGNLAGAGSAKSAMMPLNVTELYEKVRAQIEHEDNLLTQRLNWFLTSQSFLFTAYAIVFNGTPPAWAKPAIRSILMQVIPLIGVAAGALILIAIVAGAIVMHDLRRSFQTSQSAAADTGLPPLQGRAATRFMGLLAPLLLPVMFIAVWTVLFNKG